MMEGKISKLGAMFLAVAMAMSLTAGMVATALADESASGESAECADAEITFEGVGNGDTIKAYEIVGYSDDGTSYVFDAKFEDYIAAEKGSEDISCEQWLENHKDDISGIIGQFVSEASFDDKEHEASDQDQADANGKASLALQPGYYLIRVSTTASNLNIYEPLTVFVEASGLSQFRVFVEGSLLSEDSAVHMKSTSGPSIAKKVAISGTESHAQWGGSTATQVGNIEKFYTRIMLPNFDELPSFSFNLRIQSTLTNLEFIEENGVKAYVKDNGPDSEGYKELKDAIAGEPQYASGMLTIELNDKTLADAGLFSSTKNELYIVYDAKVTPDMAATNSAANEAILFCNVAHDESLASDPQIIKLFGYSINLNKVDASNNSLGGSSFKVYDAPEGEAAIAFVRVDDENGSYYRPATDVDDDAEKVTEIAAADGIDGNSFVIRGLNAGDYYFEESMTPSDHHALTGRFEVSLDAVTIADGVYASSLGGESSITCMNKADNGLIQGTVGSEDSADTFIIMVKSPDFTPLPTLDGMGRAIFVIAGVALILVAGVRFALSRRRQH